MCLVIKSEHPIVAEKPITCYKVLWHKEDKLYSFVYSTFEWEMNKVHTTTLQEGEKLEDGRGTVNQGFHSYKDLHSAWLSINRAPCECLECLAVECIIPKGAKYYTGEDGDNLEGYASEKLKPIKVMTIEELFTKFYGEYPFKKGRIMVLESKYIPSSPCTFTIANIHIYESFVKLELESTTRIDDIFSHTYFMDTDFEGNPLIKDESIIAYGMDSLMNPETEE
jgi:hypothetical protein